jgi:hypothetical protein
MLSFGFSMEIDVFLWFFNVLLGGYFWYQQNPSTQDYLGLPLVPAKSIYAGLPGAT